MSLSLSKRLNAFSCPYKMFVCFGIDPELGNYLPVLKRHNIHWFNSWHLAYDRKSKMQCFVTLNVTKAECVSGTSCVQDMLYGKQFLESPGLKVQLPMVLYMNNKGRVDMFNNWSSAVYNSNSKIHWRSNWYLQIRTTLIFLPRIAMEKPTSNIMQFS